jgi:hypothetical protein
MDTKVQRSSGITFGKLASILILVGILVGVMIFASFLKSGSPVADLSGIQRGDTLIVIHDTIGYAYKGQCPPLAANDEVVYLDELKGVFDKESGLKLIMVQRTKDEVVSCVTAADFRRK